MASFDDPTGRDIESMRQSIAALADTRTPPADRERAVILLEELQRLQTEHRAVERQLRGLLVNLGTLTS